MAYRFVKYLYQNSTGL